MKVTLSIIVASCLVVCIYGDCYRQKGCANRGKKYKDGETWTPQSESCYSCQCYTVRQYVVRDFVISITNFVHPAIIYMSHWLYVSTVIDSIPRRNHVCTAFRYISAIVYFDFEIVLLTASIGKILPMFTVTISQCCAFSNIVIITQGQDFFDQPWSRNARSQENW